MMREERYERSDESNMIFGSRPIIEAIDAGKEFEKIFIQRELNNPLIKDLKTLMASHNIGYQSVPQEKLNRLTRKNHQGVVGFLSLVSYHNVESLVPSLFGHDRFPLLLLLDRVTDVRNFGAICRTAECFGVDAVIVPEKGGALVNGDALKASAGAISRIKICKEFNLKNTIGFLKDSGFSIVGCTEKANEFAFNHQFNGPVCLIMGSEADGISPEYLKRCDSLVSIPMIGKTASLNVSVAAGIVMYEVVRQLSKAE